MPLYKTKGKKDGKIRYRVKINYTDNLGVARQVERVTYGLDEAKQLERELEKEYSTKEAPVSRMTVQELYDEFIKTKKPEVRETTYKKLVTNLETHVLPHIGNTKLDKLNVSMIQQWKQTIQELNNEHVTNKNIFGYFRQLLNYAVKMNYIPKNPLAQVGNFKAPFSVPERMDYYTAEEFKTFIQALKTLSEDDENKGSIFTWNYYVFFCIAFYTGMRKGEINALQWTDIIENHISVTKSVTQKLKGGDRITPPKNKSSIRTLQMPKPLIDIIEEHKGRYMALEGFSDKLFVCGGVKCLRDSTIERMNQKAAEAAGIKKIRIHDFRHSHASLLANEGINVQEIARRLGHSDIKMTWNTYAHLYPKEEERAVAILDKIV